MIAGSEVTKLPPKSGAKVKSNGTTPLVWLVEEEEEGRELNYTLCIHSLLYIAAGHLIEQ